MMVALSVVSEWIVSRGQSAVVLLVRESHGLMKRMTALYLMADADPWESKAMIGSGWRGRRWHRQF
jgi:hypothetical protein